MPERMGSPALLAGALTLGAAAASAQTAPSFDEAVRANVALATSLCARTMIEGTRPSTVFGNAGFVYRGVDRGVNNFGITLNPSHYFDAPAETAKAEVMNPNAHAGLCTVYTTHMTQADLNSLVAAVLFRDFRGVQPQADGQWIIQTQGGLPLIVSTNTIGTNNRYETPGTVSVGMTFPG